MTVRPKPVAKRSRGSSWEGRDRRNFLMTLGFGSIVVAAIVLLVIAVGYLYYDAHLVSVGSVNGQAISKDELRDRVLIESWRLDEADRRIRTQTVAGRLTKAQAASQTQLVTQQRQQVVAISLERIIDNRIQASLAPTEGVTVTEADVDARLVEEATTSAARHVWAIEVKPELSTGAVDPTPAQIAAARTKIDSALKDLKAGKAWEEVAKAVSTDAATAAQGGDLGWVTADNGQLDEALLKALFMAQANQPTDVIAGSDGILRIGRVTEISPASVDDAYQAKLTNDGVDLTKYRAVARGDALRKKLEAKVVADATVAGPQRQVLELHIPAGAASPPPEGVKVRHILYSPKHDPQAAQDGTIPADDPSWAAAEALAKAAYDKIKADPALFDSIARTDSDETSARGPTGTGGKLSGYVTADSGFVDEFKNAVLVPGLTDGQVLPPFKSAFGWHVVQIMYHPTDEERMKLLKSEADKGADFGTLARDNSEAPNAGTGGDLGWVAKGQLTSELIGAIFSAPIGQTSQVVTTTADGVYLFKVLAEATRTPDGRQLDEITQRAFGDWYKDKRAGFQIVRDPAITNPTN